jgi:hypothetical protein
MFALILFRHSYFTLNPRPRQLFARHFVFLSLIDFLNEYGLRNKIIEYVKGKGSNLNTMTNATKFVVTCDNLSMEESP